MSDSQRETVERNYWTYIDGLDQSSTIQRFARFVNVHDAFVGPVTREDNILRLRLLTGDLQVGYWQTDLTYRNATISYGEAALFQAARRPRTEVWYDEFSSNGSQWIHRFLLWPRFLTAKKGKKVRGEFHIKFDEMNFNQVPLNGREFE